MTDWNPVQYLQYAGERLRPALDLLARVPLEHPRTIVDLGCGAGNVTRLLALRWPEARIIGVDNSAAMLAQAREELPDRSRHTFVESDLALWRPEAPVDLVYSNAALHWLPGHATLFPEVAAMVADNGVLAVQMPDNFRAPSHTAINELAASLRWRGKLAPFVRESPVAAPADYFAWLTPSVRTLDVWQTQYLQVLSARDDGEHPVAAWTRGTWLVPLLATLDESERAEFLRAYEEHLAVAYPRRPDGCTLFPFKRLFMVGNR
jgi:trans-aconitate 2-methyltransferase